MLIPEALGLGNWVKAQEWAAIPGGQATYLGNPVPWGTLPTILVIEFIAIAFVEHQRSMEKDPEKKKYPGGAFDPLGYSKDPSKLHELKVKEIKNGMY
jgi:light-harvesting complex I chlorophyll a/b binding protein 1